MRPRQNIIDLFSTFVQFAEDYFSSWGVDLRLRRSMENCLKRLPEATTSEKFWALYWHNIWRTKPDPFPYGHLSAYLQEACYWAAQQTISRFANTQYKLSDCFQIAIAQVNKVLKGFDPNHGSNLKSYATVIFKSVIISNLRQHREADLCSDWGLLRKLSQKRLEKSLENAGLTPETIERYILAWTCFKTLYVPKQATNTQQLSKPDSQTWDAIAQLYNRQRHSQLPSPGAEYSPENLEKWLKKCANFARSYLYPQVNSLNMPKMGQESGELLDNLPSPNESESLLNEIIIQEEVQKRQLEQAQLNTVLVEALSKLKPPERKLLKLYYSQGLTQQQIAQKLKMKQYNVSRRLSKARELLLKELAKWSEEKLDISLNSEVIKQMSAVLEEWLQGYYGKS
ncbi:MAG: sigma-70 family RNA polymerase sigma factor [Moorea sp. SIO2B7]|nr:sigma-70 family RNA polymerase sigma factor [Moorena sp. SIO2B7]